MNGILDMSSSTKVALPKDKSTTPQPSASANSKSKSTSVPALSNLPVPIPMSSRRSEKLDMDTVERKGKRPRDPAYRQHAGGIKEAKTFRPTGDEWRNPMAYVRSIADEGAKYGIIKIVPPDSWNPEFAMDTERFHFKTRKQELNSVEGGTRANGNYIEQLHKFHKQFGGNVMRFPQVDKKPLDLYELKKAVQARGGFEKVCERKKWAEVGRALGYSGKIMSSLSTSLKHSYERWLYPYEQWLVGVKPGVQMQIEMERGGPFGTPSPGASPFSPMKRSHPHTPSNLSKESPTFRASQALQMTVGGRETQSQPPELPLAPPHMGGFGPVNPTVGPFIPANPASVAPQYAPYTNGISPHPDQRPGHQRSASNSFTSTPKPLVSSFKGYNNAGTYGSFELKRSYSEIEDDKDRLMSIDQPLSKRMKADPAPTVTGSHMFQHRFPNLAASFKATTNGQSSEQCETCGKSEAAGNIVICETCDNGYHLRCLEPPLPDMPKNEWHCSRCLVGTGEYGFGEGSIYSLKQFQVKANDFKENYFKGKTAYDPVHNKSKAVTEDDVEKEFWRLVTNVNETVEVEYGADIHSTTHGSGFPTVERNPRDPMATDPWNLNVLPLHADSLFKHIKSDISGMTVPWVYVGMCFSTFCWHNEDHYAYSANYQHFGATKTWYGIPGSDAVKFEAAMRARIPDLFESQPDLLDQLTTLLEPEHLMKSGVTVYAVDQRAGEFVITFPQAYHAGFNHGFNFNEAVNFAPSDWEPFGRAGVERRREFRKQPCFSHDELLFTAAAAKDVPIKTAKWLAPAVQAVADREMSVRRAFEQRVQNVQNSSFFKPHDEDALLMPFERQTDAEDLPPNREEEYVCSYCKTYSYLSRFACHKINKVACLDHIAMVDWTASGTENHFVLHCRHLSPELGQIVQKIKDTSTRPDAWTEKYHLATDGIPNPSLKTMKSLLTEGERIPWPLEELPMLRKSVEACNEWVEEAINFIARKQQNRRKNEKAWRKPNHVKGNDAEDKEREFRKIGNIRRLLHRAERLAFDCPEITTLQEKLDSVKAYQHSVRKAMENLASMSIEDVTVLMDEGKGYGIDIPEVSRLHRILEQMQWLDRARNVAEYSTLKGVDSLLEDGVRLEVPPTHERIDFLRTHKHAGETLQVRIQEWLTKQETINLAQLEIFSKTAASVPVSEEVKAEMNAVLQEHREAQKRIQAIVTATQNEDPKKRPTYKAMKDCQDSLARMINKPEGWLEMEKLQKKHEDWMRRGKKLFGKANAPLPILHQHLKIIDLRNQACFDTSEKPSPPVEPQSREHSPVDNAVDFIIPVDLTLYCLCRKPEDGTMIECKICHEWYHSKCLKIARGKYKEEDDFTCPICDHNIVIPRDAIRPRLEEMVCWQSEIPRMPFIPEEEETLNSVVSVAQEFRNHVQPIIHNPMFTTMEEVPSMRFYLRKIEGADILLTEETNFFRQELYKKVPVAPEAPGSIKFSLSTRKPRPTKEQRLMKEHGVSKPEELPANVRSRPYAQKKGKIMSEKEKEEARSRGETVGTPIQFRQPLTATAFPQKEVKARHDSQKSPQVSTPMAASHDRASTSRASPATDSPQPFGSAGAGASPLQDEAEVSHIDPSLSLAGFGERDGGANETSHSTEIPQSGNIFDHEGASGGGLNSNFDSMFADLTNDDDTDKGESLTGVDSTLDSGLVGIS